jgi:hypothetical protein
MEGIKGIWSLQGGGRGGEGRGSSSPPSSSFDKYLVQAYTWETRVLWVDEDDEVAECEVPGFRTDCTSLFCGDMSWPQGGGEGFFLVQVTPQAARLVSAGSGELLHEVTFEKKVMVAEGNDRQVGGGVCVFVCVCVLLLSDCMHMT